MRLTRENLAALYVDHSFYLPLTEEGREIARNDYADFCRDVTLDRYDEETGLYYTRSGETLDLRIGEDNELHDFPARSISVDGYDGNITCDLSTFTVDRVETDLTFEALSNLLGPEVLYNIEWVIGIRD